MSDRTYEAERESLLDLIGSLRTCLANWMEIADDEDKRDTDYEMLARADEALREAGREP